MSSVSFRPRLWQIVFMDGLRDIRNELLGLHKSLLEIERESYEAKYGKVTNLELLNLLIENERFAWLREISGLVAEIDEMFASKSGIDSEFAEDLFNKAYSLFDESEENNEFKSKYQANLDVERVVQRHHTKLISLFEKGKA